MAPLSKPASMRGMSRIGVCVKLNGRHEQLIAALSAPRRRLVTVVIFNHGVTPQNDLRVEANLHDS